MANGIFNPRTKVWKTDLGAYRYTMDVYLGEKILEALDENPDRIIQKNHEEGTDQTCKDVKLASIRVAQNLQRLGIQSNDVIGFICRNSSNILALIYGCVLIGVPINPLHVSFTKEKIQHMFKLTKPVLVFCDHDIFELAKEALREIKSNAMIFTLLKKIPVVPYVNELLIPTGSENRFKPIKFDEPACEKLLAIVCSSETTDTMKGVCMPHTAVLIFIDMHCKGFKEFTTLNFSPLSWCTGLIGNYLAPFRSGETKISTIQPFNSELCVKLIEHYKVSVIVMTPTHLNALINSPASRTGNFTSLILFSCTGSVVSENLREKFKKRFPDKPLLISYGTTEVFIAAMFPTDSNDGHKVGRMYTNIEVKVVDEEGNALDIGEVGEILAKPEFKFLGYYNEPQKSQEAVDRDGFLKTGDVGFLDKDGVVHILDRNKDIFKYKDQLITPSEIENVIESLEGVEMVAVVGVPDPKVSNLSAAVIVKRQGFEHITEHDVLATVAEKLPFSKQLYGGVYFVNEMPITANGKILRRLVKEIAAIKYKNRINA